MLSSLAKVKYYQGLFLKEDLIGRDKASGVSIPSKNISS